MAVFQKLGDYKNFGLLIMRVGLGIMMITHGYPKLMAGPEMWAKLGGAMGEVGIHFAPAFWGFMAAAAEGIGGMLVVLGLFFRPVCIFLIINMAVAAHHHLFTGGSFGDASHAIELGIVFAGLLFIGPGAYSIDRK